MVGYIRGTIRALFSFEFFVILAVIGGGVFVALNWDQVSGYTESPSYDEQKVEELIFEKINEIRVENNLSELETNNALNAAADSHSQDMVNREFFAHENPDGLEPKDRMRLSGVQCQSGGENIAQSYWNENVDGFGRISTNQQLAEHLVEMWMESDGHRKIILKSHWDLTGIGLKSTSDDKIYATQKFCSQ
jgi:uncharacterized protein YkwD